MTPQQPTTQPAEGDVWYTASTTWKQQAQYNYAELREAQTERDAALARAEAAEKERDELRNGLTEALVILPDAPDSTILLAVSSVCRALLNRAQEAANAEDELAAALAQVAALRSALTERVDAWRAKSAGRYRSGRLSYDGCDTCASDVYDECADAIDALTTPTTNADERE